MEKIGRVRYEAFSRPIDGCHSPDATDAKKQDTLTFSKICTHAANFCHSQLMCTSARYSKKQHIFEDSEAEMSHTQLVDITQAL